MNLPGDVLPYVLGEPTRLAERQAPSADLAY